MELLKFENVGLSFKRKKKGAFWALKDVSFDLKKGKL